MSVTAINTKQCAHCGEECNSEPLSFQDKDFCCQGCKMVFQIINETGLCDYYQLNENPGISQKVIARKDKFAFLEDKSIQQQLVTFSDENQTHICFYLPQMHCSSCLYILENLHKINKDIISSSVNFTAREVNVIFNKDVTLREVAELLTSIGYEPYISLNNLDVKKPKVNKQMIYQLGVAGFCFGNVMLLSFPEYLGLNSLDYNLQSAFRTLSVLLALPVFFYSAQPFYISAWKGLANKFLNIDAPIALAIIVTFVRSVFEVVSGHGSGYFDSMTGIVFFMLVGRVLQDRTYQQLSFERDYTSYFPIAVSVIKDNVEVPTPLPKIKLSDTLLIHNEELIPADGLLTKGKALIDYSFVTGESIPVLKEMGEIVYAGGKQMGGNIEILVMKEVSQSYLTSLWTKSEIVINKEEVAPSFVHLLSRYFTYIVFAIAIATATYWGMHNPAKIWPSVTAILIIACPCALLLSSTFTNGNVLRILSNNHFYLRSSQVIEAIAKINHIVFDKTGTLTTTQEQEVSYKGKELTTHTINCIALLASQSNHPLNKMLIKHLKVKSLQIEVKDFKEYTGKGIEGYVGGDFYRIGSHEFLMDEPQNGNAETNVFIAKDGDILGKFIFHNHYRKDISTLIKELQLQYKLSVISGDNAGEETKLKELVGNKATLLFHQQPEDKLKYIEKLQESGKNVLMIGDGLNDAGALRKSNAGIAVAEDCNNFTPASDAIIEAKQLPNLNKFIIMCKANKRIVIASFVLSIVYNLIGVFYSVQGNLSPMIAAILMPSSSLTILLITYGSSNLVARWLGLKRE